MNDRVVIATAGNVLPAALASLRALGYVVTVAEDGQLCRAEKENVALVAEDPLLLLGLVKLYELKGREWRPSDAEVEAYLTFDEASNSVQHERADVWEEQGAVHMLCATAHGDPVELSETEAQEFASRLAGAIEKAIGSAG